MEEWWPVLSSTQCLLHMKEHSRDAKFKQHSRNGGGNEFFCSTIMCKGNMGHTVTGILVLLGSRWRHQCNKWYFKKSRISVNSNGNTNISFSYIHLFPKSTWLPGTISLKISIVSLNPLSNRSQVLLDMLLHHLLYLGFLLHFHSHNSSSGPQNYTPMWLQCFLACFLTSVYPRPSNYLICM